MNSLLKSIALIIILITPAFNGIAQKIFEQTLKFEQVLEWINRYYVEPVNEEVLVDHAIIEMIREYEPDTTQLPDTEIKRLIESYHSLALPNRFANAMDWIEKRHTGTSDTIDQEKLAEAAIIELLAELDPHSSYLTRKEVEEMNEPLQGNFEGIGVSFNILKDTIFIISPVENGPSDKVGIEAGDRIIEIDGNNVAGIGITSARVYELLRGKKGTKVAVSILRQDSDKLLDFEIIRDKIPIYSIDASYKVDEHIGYIKVNRFALTTIDEFEKALKQLKDEGVDNLILDLTGNGGGYLEVAIALADEFIDGERLILYTEGLRSPRKEYISTNEGEFQKGNLVILIDEGSASASEILSGAIQDWDCGIIVGRRSFGKGLVQKPLPLIDKSMIRLTVAKYYTPTGRLIQKPYNINRDDYEKDLLNRYLNGEMAHKDSIHLPDSLKYYTLKNARLVYGSGGIMPDYFVSIDTSYYSEYFSQMVRKGIIGQFVLEYVDKNRKELISRYPDIKSFKKDFLIKEQIWDQLIKYGNSHGVQNNERDIDISKIQIEMLLRAYIARDLWSNSEFYEISNEQNPNFETAVMILKDWDKFESMLLNMK
jgi:carboxyl-terminal processing protease